MDVIQFLPSIYAKFIPFILVITRITSLFTAFVFFRHDLVNSRVTLSLAGILSFYVVMLTPHLPVYSDVLSLPVLKQLFFQVLIGFMTGLIINIVFDVFTGVGQFIAAELGLGMLSLVDPRLGNISTLTMFYNYSALMIFLALNGHLFVIQMIMDSFGIIPLGYAFIPGNVMTDILHYSTIIFSQTIILSIIVLVSMMLTNFTMALMSKFAPQFNIFSIGVNMSLVIGLICVYLTFGLYTDKASGFLESGMTFLKMSIAKLGYHGS